MIFIQRLCLGGVIDHSEITRVTEADVKGTVSLKVKIQSFPAHRHVDGKTNKVL